MSLFKDTESTYTKSSRQDQGIVHLVHLILIICLHFLTPHSIATAQTVHFPDPNLRAALEGALGKEVGDDITQVEMASLASLYAFESGIQDLTGLEFAVNLTGLRLGLNEISDLSALRGLTSLKVLDLHRNRKISDLSPLRDLTQLTWLSLRGNKIVDVSPLKDLRSLTYLHVGYNKISDVTPLQTLTNLTNLNLDANRMLEVSVLKGLINLVNLAVDDNQISDVSPLKDLTNLQFLNLNDNRKISDVSPLKNLTNLKFLDLHGNEISDVSPLKNLTNLINLRLQENQISDVSPLKDLTNLKFLNLSDNHILDFSPIAGLVGNLIEYGNQNQLPPSFKAADINRDGTVEVADLVLVAFHYRNPDFATLARFGIYPDVNSDGVVDIKDIVAVASEIEATAAAPTLGMHRKKTLHLTVENLQHWIYLAKQLNGQEPYTEKGIAVLEQLLTVLTGIDEMPEETGVLANFPNPFNPETWIPYQLSKSARVSISIYAADGKLVRALALGTLSAGVYHSKSRAAYWDGRNALGEAVASGVYFYTFTTDDFTATGKMIIQR